MFGTRFQVILNDLPIDFFVESMPHSLSILEALYAKVFLSDGLNFSMKLLRPEAVVMQMVKFFSNGDLDKNADKWEYCGPFVCSCKKLLKVKANRIWWSRKKNKKICPRSRSSLYSSFTSSPAFPNSSQNEFFFYFFLLEAIIY